ncbi:hypothetical protein MNBD_GAMMA14-1621 [hydrothermal vent metagenome]|uniref:DUF1841 domain-containing protein n=1 Tax=hydrothermal vent metagenome TaxID=652676 RepID=A0A3B0XYS6_9ZZZZ
MLFGQDRDQLRRYYCTAWQTRCKGMPLDPLQKQIVTVIEQHPEYHQLVENPERAITKDYLPELGESNPFLHMGMHLGLREQIDTDRPAGIKRLYQHLLEQHGDAHELEHKMMECLAEMIWQAQKTGTAPDEVRYVDCLKSLEKER